MKYKIELRYFYGWDDAVWTEELDGEEKPMRFQSVQDGEVAICEFMFDVRRAVTAGNWGVERDREDFRVVAVND